MLVLGTVIFVVSEIDLAISGWFYDSAKEEWGWRDFPLFSIVYDYGTLPAALLAGVGLVVLFAGVFWQAARRWRKIVAYYVLVVIIGPGILINAVFKEHWGRPRPRDVSEFEGRDRFERVWEYDAASSGKSFPSGHASMGFCLFALYFVARATHRRYASWSIAVALSLGGLLGLTRVAQGGHFASDVLWSAGFCYATALILGRLMRLEERPWYEGPGGMSRLSLGVTAVGVLGAAALAFAIPYGVEKEFVGRELASGERSVVKVELDLAELFVKSGERFRFTSNVEAFGSFGSEVFDQFKEDVGESGDYTVSLRQSEKGSFASIEQPAELSVPSGSSGEIRVKVSKGSVKAELFEGDWEWRIECGGDVALLVPEGLAVKVSRGEIEGDVANSVEGLEWSTEKGRWKRGEAPAVKVRVIVGGDLTMRPAQAR